MSRADEMSIAAIAARERRSPDEVAYDYLTGGRNRFLFFPVVNYVNGDHGRSARCSPTRGRCSG